MICNQCGTENVDGMGFCRNCGAPLNAEQPNAAQPNNASYTYTQQPNPTTVYVEPQIPAGYEPISMWGYFGYELLFSIPCVGFILLLVFAFGGTGNVNVKNFARSYFCFLIIAVVLALAVMAATGGALYSSGLF